LLVMSVNQPHQTFSLGEGWGEVGLIMHDYLKKSISLYLGNTQY